jgi:hypothetical protein
MGRDLNGPGKFFADHPAVYALSLSGAGTAVGVFAARAAQSRGTRRLGWIILFALEAAIFIGVVVVREDARRSTSPT